MLSKLTLWYGGVCCGAVLMAIAYFVDPNDPPGILLTILLGFYAVSFTLLGAAFTGEGKS